MRLNHVVIGFALASCLIVVGQAAGGGQLSAQLAAKRAAGQSNLKQITVGVLLYVGDWDDVLPYAQSTRALGFVTAPYTKSRAIWATQNPKGSRFAYNLNVGGVEYSGPPAAKPVSGTMAEAATTAATGQSRHVPGEPKPAIAKPAQTPMLYETKEWSDGARLVSFIDGHARAVTAGEWPAVKKALTWHFKRTTKPLPVHYGESFHFPDEGR